MDTLDKIVLKNSEGVEIEFSANSPFFLLDIDGLDGLKSIVSLQKVYNMCGAYLSNMTDNTRNIILTCKLKRDKFAEDKNYILRNIINRDKVKLYYYKDNVCKYIDCVVEQSAKFASTVEKFKYNTFLISLLCPNPYWNSVTTNQSELSNFINKFEFPLEFTEDGFKFGGEGKNITIENNGDVETPLKIKFIGEMKNPKLINKTTGEFIKIEYSLSNKDNLIIDTSLENRKITLNNSNAYGILSLDSTLFSLQVGTNEIAFENESNSNAKVILEYNNKFISI